MESVLNLDSDAGLAVKADELKAAFLAMDARAVGDDFTDYFSFFTHDQRLDGGPLFRLAVRSLLLALGFKAAVDTSSPEESLDLCFELAERVFVVIGLRFCRKGCLVRKITKF